MAMFAGKKGVIMGVANNLSLATAIAEFVAKEGATIGYSHLPDPEGTDKMQRRVRKAIDHLNPAFVHPCDVSSDASIADFFGQVGEEFGKIDFLVHSIAFAPVEDIRCPVLQSSRAGFLQAMDISVYSLIATANRATELFNPGASVLAMTYFGGEKVVAGYNMMGLCKAALDQTIRYLAYDLGEQGVRVNGLSAGPLKTLASSAVGDFSKMMKLTSRIAPLRKNVSAEEVAKASAFLLSDLSSGTTGEILHVDAGYNIMGGLSRDMLEGVT